MEVLAIQFGALVYGMALGGTLGICHRLLGPVNG